MKKEDELVKCPYYKKDGVQSVHCEGVEDACGLHLGFAAKGQMNAYKKTFCREDWKRCMVAKMLNAKYDYEP